MIRCSGVFLWIATLGPWPTQPASAASRQASEGPIPAPEATRKPRLMLFTQNATDPLILRVGAELESQGFSVVTVAAPAIDITSREAESIAHSSAAVALVRIVPHRDRVNVSISDLIRNQTYEHTIFTDADRAVTSLRVVEVLRSRLTDLLALAPKATTSKAKAMPEPKRRTPASPAAGESVGTQAALEVAIAVAKSTGDSGLGVLAHIAYRSSFAPPYGLEAQALIPVSSSSLDAGNVGSAEIDFGLLTVGALYRPLAFTSSPWVTDFGLGAGGLLLQAEGVADSRFDESSQTRLSFFPYLRTGLGLALSDAFRARADVLAGAAIPRAELLADDVVFGTWGRLILIATFGMEGVWH